VAPFFYISDGSGHIAGILGLAGKGAVYAEECCCGSSGSGSSGSGSSGSGSGSGSTGSGSGSGSTGSGSTGSGSTGSTGSTGSGSGSGSGPTPFPGTGWYCVSVYEGETCESLELLSTACAEITTQAAWDAYQFGVCVDTGNFTMWTTDYVKHATEVACQAACGV
jgi:hypothetical protein